MHASRRPVLLPSAITVLFLAAVVLGAVARTRGPEARRARTYEAAREAALRAQGAPRQRWGAPLKPAPLISRGKPVAASRPGAEVLVDGVYRDKSWAYLVW